MPKTTPLQLQAASSGTSLPAPTPSGGFPEVHAPLASAKGRSGGVLPWAALGVVCLLGVGAGVGYVFWDGQQGQRLADAGVTAHTPPDSAVGVTQALPLAGDAAIGEQGTTHIQNGIELDAGIAEAESAPDAEVQVAMVGVRPNRPSATDVRRARQMLDRAAAAIGSRNVPQAAREIAGARRILGGQDSRVRSAQQSLSGIGSNLVAREIQNGNCAGATRLYRTLRSAGAHRRSNIHSAGWCPLR